MLAGGLAPGASEKCIENNQRLDLRNVEQAPAGRVLAKRCGRRQLIHQETIGALLTPVVVRLYHTLPTLIAHFDKPFLGDRLANTPSTDRGK